jgi:RTX calcium-binding nonapeptide repeat (4 copies)
LYLRSPAPHHRERERTLLMRLPAAPLILLGAMVVLLLGGGVALAKTITGTNGPDTLIGTTSPDQISALRGGDDYVDGMQGDDALYGNQGNDRVLGRGGKDRMAGGLHRDVLLGGSANDTIRAVDGYEDSVDCGTGTNDTAYIDLALDTWANCENVNPPKPQPSSPPRPIGAAPQPASP